MEPLSVAIITRNEARRLPACLNAVEPIADEIVVLDSGSDDNTLEIAQKFGALTFSHPFDNFVNQKNRATEFCTHRLVLSLDADEVLSPELARSIAEVKNNPQFDVYSLQRLNFYAGKPILHGGWFPDPKLRLYFKNCGAWDGINLHERFVPKPESSIGKLNGFLLHYSFDSVEKHRKKSRHYASLAASDYALAGKKSFPGKGLIHGLSRWLRDYIFRLGFLDGKAGWQIATITLHEIILKYKMLNQINKNKKA